MKIIKHMLPHITAALALAVMVILVIDTFVNNAMGFVYSGVFKRMCMLLCLLSIATGALAAVKNEH